MSTMDHIMPLPRRILISIPIPIPPRHAMLLLARHPTTILNPAPRRLVRDRIFPPPTIVFLHPAPRPRERGILSLDRVLPARPVGSQVRPRSPRVSGPDDADVDIGSFVGEDVEKAPAPWPVVFVSGSGVFGPDPA